MKYKDVVIDPAYRYPLYYPVRRFIQTGDLMEWSTDDNFAAWSIRKKTKKDVNHSAMFVRSKIPGHRDRIFIIEAVSHGVVSSVFTHRLNMHKGKVWWYPLDPAKVPMQKRYDMLYWTLTQVGSRKGYDFEDLLKQLTESVALNYNKFFCSELYHAGLIEAGIIPTEWEYPARRPGEFAELGVHKERVLIYEA